MPKSEILYLTKDDVEKVVTMKDIVEAVDEGYRVHGEGQAFQPVKECIWIDSEKSGFFISMPVYLPTMKLAGTKWLNLYMKNPGKGIPLTLGLIILNEIQAGLPIAIMDACSITYFRTAAHGAAAAKYLAKKNSSLIAIIGCGAQGRTHLEAMNVLFPLKEAKIFDIKEEVMEGYIKEMGEKLSLEIKAMPNAKEAVRDVDIVCMTTTASKPVVFEDWIGPGCFVDGSFSFYDLDPMLSKKADKWVLGEYESDTHLIIEDCMGNLTMSLSRDDVYAEVGEIAAGKKLGRETDKERIVYTHLGMGLHDVAAANVAYRKAKEMGVGLKIPYVY